MAKTTSKDAAKSAKNILASLEGLQATSSKDMFSDFFGASTPEEKKEIEEINVKDAEKEIVENREGYAVVSVSDLVSNPLSQFHMRQDESWKSIKSMMQKHGFVQGFLVTGIPLPDGKIRLISGHRRTAIAKSLGITKVPAVLLDVKNEAEELDLVLAANHNRGETVTDLLKNYLLCEEKCKEGIWDDEKKEFTHTRAFIASKMGIPESRIVNHLFLLTYDPIIWIMIDDKVFSVNDIRKLYAANQKGKIKNHDVVIKKIVESKDTLLDPTIPIEIRKESGKKILEKIQVVETKKPAQPADKMMRSWVASIEKKDYIIPEDEKRKADLQKSIERARAFLDKVEQELK